MILVRIVRVFQMEPAVFETSPIVRQGLLPTLDIVKNVYREHIVLDMIL